MNNTVPDDHRRERQTPSVPQSDDTQMTEVLMRQSTNTIDQRPKAMKYKKRRERVLRQNRLPTIQNRIQQTEHNKTDWFRLE